MENFIQAVNRLQDAFATIDMQCPFDLPQIAVVGEQSAGKSSVLENFVGKDFLPRGAGIVTRRPLVLQLIHQNGPEYAEFIHLSNKKFTDFSKVCDEIRQETDRVTGSDKNISPLPINLKIYSPDVLNLTLIDLPGITKNPVGDQPADIEKQIRDMIISYISKPNCLILSVIPAVVDLANSESLKLAREVDPHGLRTIGVITKIDMMGEGTDCLDILNNKVYHLSRGYVGIVNRSQKDIVGKKNILAAQESELNFFKSHPKYAGIVNRLGSQFLQQTLNQQLSKHIKETLPCIRQSIIQELSRINGVIESKPEMFEQFSEDQAIASKILMSKVQAFCRRLDTVWGFQNDVTDFEEETAGAKIGRIIGDVFFEEVDKIKPVVDEVKKQIKIAIMNAQGVRQGIFSPSSSFLAVIKSHIRTVKGPSMMVLDHITNEVNLSICAISDQIFNCFPDLNQEVQQFFLSKIQSCRHRALERITFFMDIHTENINTNHPDFLSAQNPNSSSGTGNQSSVTGIENIIHKEDLAYLSSSGLFKSNKQYYSLIKGQAFIVYKDSSRKEVLAQFLLSECKIQATCLKQKFNIRIIRKDGMNLMKNIKNVDLLPQTGDEAESWRDAFFSAGIDIEGQNEPTEFDSNIGIDVELKKNIEYVYLLVDSYYKITVKSIQDLISKICVFCLIETVRNSVLTELVLHLYSLGPIGNYMRESSQNQAERKKVMGMYNSCKEALEIINTYLYSTDLELGQSQSHIPSLPRKTNFRSENSLVTSTSYTSGPYYGVDEPKYAPQPVVKESLTVKRDTSQRKILNMSPHKSPDPPVKKIVKPQRPPPSSTSGSKFYVS